MTKRNGSKKVSPQKQPKLRTNKKGFCSVRIGGKDYYCGKAGERSTTRKYNRFIDEIWRNHGTVNSANEAPEIVTLDHLIADFLEDIRVRKSHDKKEIQLVTKLMTDLANSYGDLEPMEFTPIQFKSFRRRFQHLAYSSIKRRMQYVIQVFQLGDENGLCSPECASRLKRIKPIPKGQCGPGRNVTAVSHDIIHQTLPELTPTVQAMVKLQLLCIARPGEICKMRPMDIRPSEHDPEVWLFSPAKTKGDYQAHKTAHHGHERVIPVGPRAMEVLAPFLDRGEDEFCFKPEESYQQHLAQRRKGRTTPRRRGNKPTRRKHKKKFKDRYDRNSYRCAIRRACDRLDIDHWTPMQLRHTGGEDLRREEGLETTQATMGHRHKSTTERNYAGSEVNLEKAIEAAKNR